MKTIRYILAVLFLSFRAAAQTGTACCPEFKLTFQRDYDCTRQGSCLSPNGASDYTASMCRYSTHTLLVTPALAGYSYAWTITGGTPAVASGNPLSVTWGGGMSGSVIVTITSADGKCVKTIKENICLREAPNASFTFGSNGACAGVPVSFSNTSTGGTNVSWSFGDGSFAGNVNTPTHVYAAAGLYNVTIYVSNDTADCKTSAPTGGDKPACCGCTTSYTLPVNVVAGSPLIITPKACINQCLCAGDTAEYCVSPTCAPPYNWTVSGGTIISGAGTSCVKVKWTGPYPTSLSLSAPNCGNPCGNTATINVPVLLPSLPIQPATSTVCQSTTQTYSLPSLPGAFYNWTVTGGTIIGPNTNTSIVTVAWGGGAVGQIACSYNNPLQPGCSGNALLNVAIKPLLKIIGPPQTCVGCTAGFSTSGGSVTWSSPAAGVAFSPATGSSTTVSFPVSAVVNTYTITATGAAGTYCNSPVSASIVVAPKPVLNIFPATAVACPNTPVKFYVTSTVSTAPVSWVLPAGATMIANTGPQMDTAVVQFGTIPPGGVSISATQNCAFNQTCSQATASASVQKPPAPILSTPVTNPCIDQSVTYAVSNAVPGVNYNWTITNTLGTITAGQGTSGVTVLWHGNNATSNQGVLTVTNCGGSASANITVKLPVSPTITKTGSCFPYTLTASTAGPYLWSGPGVTGQTTASVVITQAGSYTVTINAGAAGSCPQQKTIVVPSSFFFVRILPPCIVSACNPAAISVPFTVSTNVPSPACQWYFIPQLSNVSSPAPGGTVCNGFSGTQTGTYYLVVTNPATGCKDTSNKVRIPEDINMCCAAAPCSSLPAGAINFTHAGCSPTLFTGSFTLPSGWSVGSLPVTYCYGDGTSSTGPGLNATHQYALAGKYTACIVRKLFRPSGVPGVNDTCCVSNCHDVTIPVVAKCTAVYDCNTGLLTMTDGSSYYPSAAGATYSWTYNGTYTGTLTNGPNQVITPTSSGSFTVSVSITLAGCTSTYSVPVNVLLPGAPVTIAPNPTCAGAPASFSTVAGMLSYNWQFGDNSFSLMQSPQHIYAGAGTYNGTLTVVTPDGCTVIKSFTVTVQPKPVVTLTPTPATVCPGNAVTLTATINAAGNTMCPTLSSYTLQWYNNGNPAGGPTASPTFSAATYGTYFAILTGNTPSCNCKVNTDTAVVSWYPKPVAKIKGTSAICLTAGSGSITLFNANPSYAAYNWSSNSPAAISFSPANASSTIVTVTTPGNYQIFLEVTDVNGCKARDTLCIYASARPAVAVTAPGGSLCSGNGYLLQAIPTPATAPPAGYSYLWSTGAATSTVTVSAPGLYTVTLTNMNTGCSAVSAPVFINKAPDLSLFPSCCDTICNGAPITIVPPLPLGPGQNACAVYGIVWLDNGVPVSPQPAPCNALNTASLAPQSGLHNISIIVTLNGCSDTSNVFSLFIKQCGVCDCAGSQWGELTIQSEPKPTESKVGGQAISLKCKGTYTIKCNQTYIVSAPFTCKGKECPAKVTYSLQPPSGPAITGTAPVVFTPVTGGLYTLTLYGWCGNKICDSCIIRFKVECDPLCSCKGSSWEKITAGSGATAVSLTCDRKKPYDWTCKVPFNINAAFSCPQQNCPSQISYVLTPPSGPQISGSLPVNYVPVQTGLYTVVLYGSCGTSKCDSCILRFNVQCDDSSCCRYVIKGEAGTVTYTQAANATIAAQTFTFSGLVGVSLTEVRAEVVSYDLSSNYKNECLGCKTYPFTWASIHKAGNIGIVPPKITLFGGVTAPLFNPTGAAQYQNPREVIWNNGSTFMVGSPLAMSFFLPPPPVIDCCEIRGRICVKFTFRDNECRECEVVVCFDVSVPKK